MANTENNLPKTLLKARRILKYSSGSKLALETLKHQNKIELEMIKESNRKKREKKKDDQLYIKEVYKLIDIAAKSGKDKSNKKQSDTFDTYLKIVQLKRK